MARGRFFFSAEKWFLGSLRASRVIKNKLVFHMRYHFFQNFDDYPGFQPKTTFIYYLAHKLYKLDRLVSQPQSILLFQLINTNPTRKKIIYYWFFFVIGEELFSLVVNTLSKFELKIYNISLIMVWFLDRVVLQGQLISKTNSTVFTWTKKRTKIFFYFCPEESSVKIYCFVDSSPTQGNMFFS